MTAAKKPLPSIICIAGPTGAGKSAVAAALAEAIGGAVVNADSRQVYADFPIITAQPGAAELACCEHLLYGFLPATDKISAGKYVQMAGEAIAALGAAGKTAVLVGGTGLYFRSLLAGIADIPQVDPQIHQKWQDICAEQGSQTLHVRLAHLDPDYAAKIHPNDRQRITRALEVHEGTGRTFSWWHRQTASAGYSALYLGIGLTLEELEPLLKARITLMLKAGALEEASLALKICSDPTAPGWSGIGCAELYRHLSGELSLDACLELWFRNTRAYAKRQLTWFRGEKRISWHAPGDPAAVIELARAWLCDRAAASARKRAQV